MLLLFSSHRCGDDAYRIGAEIPLSLERERDRERDDNDDDDGDGGDCGRSIKEGGTCCDILECERERDDDGDGGDCGRSTKEGGCILISVVVVVLSEEDSIC